MRAPLICFTGIDGCGKSTQAKRLADRLQRTGWPTARVWTGGQKTLTGPLVRLGQQRLRAPRRGQDRRFVASEGGSEAVALQFSQYMSASHQLFRRHRLLGQVWTHLSLVEHALEINGKVLPQLLLGRAVVCDRYIYKSIVNLVALLDIPSSRLEHLLRHPALHLVPRPTLYFLLDVPAGVAYARKDDLPSVEYVERRAPVYRAIARLTGMPVIDGTQDPDVIEAQVWERISRAMS